MVVLTGKLCIVRGIKQLVKKQVKLIIQLRFNCTMRQRIARLVRKTLSFSKKERESYWCYLTFYPPLEQILTYLALPNF